MFFYAIQRIGLSILILITSMVMLFSALKFIPGDPATIILGSRANAEMRARITEELGLLTRSLCNSASSSDACCKAISERTYGANVPLP